jgi:hypothetical protein
MFPGRTRKRASLGPQAEFFETASLIGANPPSRPVEQQESAKLRSSTLECEGQTNRGYRHNIGIHKFSDVFNFQKNLISGKYNRTVTLQYGRPLPKSALRRPSGCVTEDSAPKENRSHVAQTKRSCYAYI